MMGLFMFFLSLAEVVVRNVDERPLFPLKDIAFGDITRTYE
jgi:hypothetical protein